MSIVSITEVPGTGLTTAGATAANMAIDIINATWNLAIEKSDEASASISAATTGFLDTLTAPHVTAGTATSSAVTEPTITIADASTTDVYDDFQTQYLELVALLADKFSAFQTAYFPDDTVFYAQAEDWLQNALADPSGLPASVRAQLLGDAQAAILTESNRAKDAVLATFATRRMPMPGGQAASAVLQIEQGAQDKMAEAGRNITKLSVDNLKFAIEKAINCRTVAMSTAVDYIKALASGPDMASRLVGTGYDAQSKMISAASQFYNSRIAAAEQVNKVSQFNVGTELDAATKNQAADLHLIDDKLKALLAEVSSLGQQTTSLLNNLHASSGMTFSVS